MNGFLRVCRVGILFLILISSQHLVAQLSVPKPFPDSAATYNSVAGNICSSDMALSRLRQEPGFKDREERMNTEIRNASSTLSNEVITLPVVFHIIKQDPSRTSDEEITKALQDLNNAFSKSGPYASSQGVDTRIRFCIAQKDPDGGNTTGITRTKSFFSTHLNKDNEDARLKNLIQWDPSRYINIWVTTSIDAEAFAFFSCGTWYRTGMEGYATMPPGGGPLDGIVVSGFGALLAHEMGHYLGLYHTFEGYCQNNNCETDGDRVCDTPPDGTYWPSGTCANPANTCSADTLSNYSNGIFPVDVPDQISNFMDYGNQACSNQFTLGQANRMRAAIQTQRAGLLKAQCTKPCVENIIAGFTRNNAYPVPGDNISFTNKSTGAANYQWLIDDVVVSAASNFSHTFSTAGKYKLTLKAFNTNNNCFATYTDYILVTCGVAARFYTNKQTIASRENIYTDTILFKNNSYNSQSYQWLVSNDRGMREQVVSTSTDLNYVFRDPGTYTIRLIATNGSCSDTTGTYTVPVLDPTPDGVPFSVSMSCFDDDKIKVNFCLANYGYGPLRANTEVNFYDGDPSLPGANRLSPAFKLPSDIPGSCVACFTHILNAKYKNLEKIFLVYNDTGRAVPVVLPNTSFVETNYANNFASSPSTRIMDTVSICEGESYLGYSKTGVYIDTIINPSTGCENIRTLNLTVRPVYKVTVTTSICEGENYAGHTTSGTYVDVYPGVNGCDSTRTLHLTVKPVPKATISATICEGEIYAGYNKSGVFTDVYKTANGCDSIRTLNLTVNPKKLATINHVMCEGAGWLAGGRLQTASGVYYDTSKTYLGCDSITITNLTVNPVPKPDLGKDRGICVGDALTLNPGPFISYVWQDESIKSEFKTSKAGVYSVSVTNTYGCVASDTMRVLGINPVPANFLPADSTLCKGNILKVQVPGYINYDWSTGDNRWFLDITRPGTYRLEVTDRNGCKGIDSINILFNNSCFTMQVPNAFTPDNDGKNDVFMPIIEAPLSNYQMQVFNRWGQLVFETKDIKKGWDGLYRSNKQAAGTYVFAITFKDLDGRFTKKSGSLVLIR